MSGVILVVDDEPGIRRSLRGALEDEGYVVVLASGGQEALQRVEKEAPDAILLDIWMEGFDGIECLRRLKGMAPDIPVIMISGHATIETAVQCTRLGAYDFLEKPLTVDRVLLTVAHALKETRLELQNQELWRHEAVPVVQSPAMKSLVELSRRVAQAMPRVLIQGENGVGKEVIARLLHRNSPRSSMPFVEVNCAAIPEELIESELFGHERGAFTGAGSRRIGKFELADGGTLFLDEIADMSLKTQAKVLRALQEGQIDRVGGERPRRVDVWVLAATNKDLQAAMGSGQFREDLYYRLNVVPLFVPALRERPEDVRPLVEQALVRFSRGREPKKLRPAGWELLLGYDWPGNVRELLNLMERLVLLAPGEWIEPESIESALRGGRGSHRAASSALGRTLREARDDFERDYIQRTLSSLGGNRSKAAQSLGLERSNFYRKLRQLGMEP